MRINMSGNLGLYKYLWPGSVYNSRPIMCNKSIKVSGHPLLENLGSIIMFAFRYNKLIC